MLLDSKCWFINHIIKVLEYIHSSINIDEIRLCSSSGAKITLPTITNLKKPEQKQ